MEVSSAPNHGQPTLAHLTTMPLPTHRTTLCQGDFSSIKALQMKILFQRIHRIRASGYAILKRDPSSPHYHLNGRRFPVHSIRKAELKCRVTLLVDVRQMDFTINGIL